MVARWKRNEAIEMYVCKLSTGLERKQFDKMMSIMFEVNKPPSSVNLDEMLFIWERGARILANHNE